VDECDLRARAVERKLEDKIEEFAAPEYSWKKRRFDDLSASIEQDANDGRDRERCRGTADERQNPENVGADGAPLTGEPPSEADVSARERIVGQIILSDSSERDR